MKTIANLFCLLLVSSCSLTAQNNLKQVLSNPDVVWAATSYGDFHPDESREYHREMELSGQSDFIKLSATAYKGEEFYPVQNNGNLSFSAKIFSEAFFKANTLFSTDDLTKAISEEEKAKILSYEEVMTLEDAKTGKKQEVVTKHAFDTKDVLFYRVKQLVFYNKKDTGFRTIPMAIAPVVGVFNHKGERTGFTTMFWIPLFETDETNVNAANHTWIKRAAYSIPLEKDCKVTKEINKLEEVHGLFFDAVQANAEKVLVYDTYEILGESKVPGDWLKNIKNSCDTIYTFDPVDFTEKVSIARVDINKNIKKVRVVQDWIWDEKTQRLNIRFLGYAPIINRYDAKGIFLNSGPMFYRRDKSLK